MKKLLVLAVVAAGAWYAWQHLKQEAPPPAPAAHDTTPGANMKQRIDNRSGVAPE